MPSGAFSVPLPIPYFAHFVIKVPLLENTCILSLPVSATYTLPDDGSTAMPSGDLKEPLSRDPNCPHFVIKVLLLLENTCILSLAGSATYTLPDDGSTATPSGFNLFPPLPSSLKSGIKESS